jgi:hypothetical protein
MAPTTKNGIAIINSTLGLNARPNESFNAAFQPGQACNAVGPNSMIAANSRKIADLLLSMAAIIVLDPCSYSYSYTYSFLKGFLKRVRVRERV